MKLRAETKFIFRSVSEIGFFLTLVGIGVIFKLASKHHGFALGSRTLFAEGVSRNVRFSTLFKVQGQMKVAGQGSSRDRFPQVYVHPLVRICRCQTLVFGGYEKKHADSVTRVPSGRLQGMGAKKKIDVTDGGNHAC